MHVYMCVDICIVDTLDLCSDLRNAEVAACWVAAALTTSSAKTIIAQFQVHSTKHKAQTQNFGQV